MFLGQRIFMCTKLEVSCSNMSRSHINFPLNNQRIFRCLMKTNPIDELGEAERFHFLYLNFHYFMN